MQVMGIYQTGFFSFSPSSYYSSIKVFYYFIFKWSVDKSNCQLKDASNTSMNSKNFPHVNINVILNLNLVTDLHHNYDLIATANPVT